MSCSSAQFGERTTALQAISGIHLSGKVVIITGASSGIGIETARAIAAAGARTILAVRDVKKGEIVASEIRETTKNNQVEVGELDLNSLASVRSFASSFLNRRLNLNILINNAGYLTDKTRSTSADGFESQIGINHIAHFLLTDLLLPALLNGAPSRVVVVASCGHKLSPVLFDDINWEKTEFNAFKSYGSSKTANILFAREFNKRYQKRGIKAFSLHPGGILTGLQKHMSLEEKQKLGWIDAAGKINPGFKTVEQGASTTIVAATSPELESQGGAYLEDCQVQKARKIDISISGLAEWADNDEDAAKLWALTEKLIAEKSPASSSSSSPTSAKFGYRTTALQAIEGISLTGKVAIVTGAASGIGIETARAIAHAGAHLILPVRDRKKGEEVLADLKSTSKNDKIELADLDLNSLASVRSFASSFLERHLPVHLLINNAGVMSPPSRTTTVDGFEVQIGVNHFGHFLLTYLLLPALVAGAPSRVVVVASCGHKIGPVNFDDINFEKNYDKRLAYASSKTATILFARELNKRYQKQGVKAFSVHPGGIMTGLQKHMTLEEKKKAGWVDAEGKLNPLFKTVEQGASTAIVAATSPELESQGGAYLEDCQVQRERVPGALHTGLAEWADSDENAEKVWTLSIKLLGL